MMLNGFLSFDSTLPSVCLSVSLLTAVIHQLIIILVDRFIFDRCLQHLSHFVAFFRLFFDLG